MSYKVEKDGVIKEVSTELERADYLIAGWKDYKETPKKEIVEEQEEEKPKKRFLDK